MSARMANCPQCGKGFCVMSPRDWAYRDGSTYYCSWKCIREHDNHIPPHPETEAPKPGPMTPEQLEKIEAEDKRIARKLQRQCYVAPKQDRRKRNNEENKKKLAEMKHLVEETGITWKDAAKEMGVPLGTMYKWLERWREELDIPKISHIEAGKKTQEKRRRDERENNRSGEKKARIIATLMRIRASLDEFSEEVASCGS